MIFARSILLAAAALVTTCASATAEVPHYSHIFVVILENHTTDEIIGNAAAPTLTKLSKEYGFASNYYGIRHPSEPNYIAMVGGDTFGIADDDAVDCKPGMKTPECEKSWKPDYANHTFAGPSLASQLEGAHLSWKGYFEDLPKPGSLVWHYPSPKDPVAGKPDALYASKHNGFANFQDVQDAPDRAQKLVGFDVLEHDIAVGTLPAFAHIVPNQCNDMHGLKGHDVPEDCSGKTSAGLIGRADRTVGHLVDEITQSAIWKAPENTAIVITFDENDDDHTSPHPDGCCGFAPGDASHPGGGWVPTIVITNHGPRALVDPTPYNHYSLLRTVEDGLGLPEHLRHASDTAKGVVPMAPLFATNAPVAPYRLSATIPLGGPEKWDFVYFDASANRAYVSHRTHVDVVDVAANRVIGKIDGIGESHGVITVPSLGRGYADDAAAKTVVVFDLKTLAKITTVPVGIDADAMAYDPATGRVFVMNADGNSVTAIDAATDSALQTVPLGGAPEMAAVDGKGRMFIAIASKNEIVAFDTAKLAVTARWSVPMCEKPHGAALDEVTGRLFVSCANARMLVLDSADGKVMANLPIGKGTDSAAFDPARKIAFSANGDGTLSMVAETDEGSVKSLGDMEIVAGARTMAVDPKSGRIFLIAADADPSAPGKSRAYVANSAKLLIFDPAQ